MRDSGVFGGVRVESASPTVRVAVVEDDDAVRETTVSLLESTLSFPDVDVVGFQSGQALLDSRDEDGLDVDCIISDYSMPGLDGLDLLREVRANDDEVPFIIYTGQGTEDVASEAISAGVTDYVRKSATDGHYLLARRIESAVRRRRAEAEREIQALAMATVEEGIAVVSAEGQFIEMNDAYAEMYGYEKGELIGEPWETINPLEENERMQLQILPALEAEGTWRGESVGLRKDGSTFVKSKSMTNLEQGGFVCAVRDVTEQRAVEDALREQNERLREFARLVSHDLRNPLNVAEGYLALVEESIDDDSVAEDVERIQNAHDRMRRLIDDMLRLAREGRVVDNTEPASLAAVANAAALTVGLSEEGSVRISDDLPMVLADDERLSALFENLFRNAVEHAGPDPTVTVGPLEDGGRVCGFYVADDGEGIPANQRVKVFESGYTTDRSGTGFGLAIVKRIASAHGWTVSIRDADGGGARFEFRGVDVADDSERAEDDSDEAGEQSKTGGEDTNGEAGRDDVDAVEVSDDADETAGADDPADANGDAGDPADGNGESN
jgi:PAS domain S-box-containing protein